MEKGGAGVDGSEAAARPAAHPRTSRSRACPQPAPPLCASHCVPRTYPVHPLTPPIPGVTCTGSPALIFCSQCPPAGDGCTQRREPRACRPAPARATGGAGERRRWKASLLAGGQRSPGRGPGVLQRAPTTGAAAAARSPASVSFSVRPRLTVSLLDSCSFVGRRRRHEAGWASAAPAGPPGLLGCSRRLLS